ncbi:MAG: FAD:protein FMN transferase [Bacteroidaceae bacterium]|nr:FAD:protein FMN transferase [Bacteroidaceae bacterium]
MTKRNILPALVALVAVVGLLFFLPPREKASVATYQHNEGTIFGTIYHAKYLCDEDLNAEIEAALQKVDASLSMFNPKSTISRINRNETSQADEMLCEVLQLSYRVNAATGGAFDPTVAPLVNAWGFGFKEGQLPDGKQVDSLRALVGLSAIHLQGDRIAKDKPLAVLDFSAIAKGYGVDKAAEVLRSHGIKDFMVEIGGEVVAEGINEKGSSWRIGINKPDDDSTSTNTELQDIVGLSEGAIATSGNYRRYYISQGRKIAHTINPLTGYPAQQDILSSTVMAPTCAEADGFATAFMVLGMEEARRVLQSQPRLEAYFIYTDDEGHYRTWCTEGFKSLIIK